MRARTTLVLGALGVVFGDIGTSPLYAVQTVFNPSDPHPVAVTHEALYGIASLIFWSVTLVVTITYVGLVMRADNNGEGGIMALITLVTSRAVSGRHRTKIVLAGLGIFGAALFLGDSMITPAISVLSAVEGLKVAEPSLENVVVPIAAGILIGLFVVQKFGTATIGRVFGPVMVVWFLTLAAFGIHGIALRPEVLEALSPTYAAQFMVHHFGTAFFALAAVVLSFTGAEALYADMGHFGRRPVTYAWLLLVFPAVMLNYLGQSATILDDPTAIANPFFLLAPSWAHWPLVVLATMATVIASQAVITGAFSVAKQAAQLGYLPRLRVVHTSEQTEGQIYVPWINWLLAVSVLTLVFTFESSAALAYAYGVAVTGTITITTLLFFYIARHEFHWRLPVVVVGGGLLLAVDLLFLAANLTKLLHGAWLPIGIGLLAFAVLTTWQRGRGIVTDRREEAEGALDELITELHDARRPVYRTPGTAVYLNRSAETVPAGHARDRRAPPGAPRARADPVARRPARPPCPDDRAPERRRPGLRRRWHLPRHRRLRLRRRDRRPRARAPSGRRADRVPCRSRDRLLLPVDDRAHAGQHAGPVALAEAPVPGHGPHRQRSGRLLRPAARPHGRHGRVGSRCRSRRRRPRARAQDQSTRRSSCRSPAPLVARMQVWPSRSQVAMSVSPSRLTATGVPPTSTTLASPGRASVSPSTIV